jgi:hypothetical protein
MMPNILREVQHIILMPRCGRHVLAGASLGLKAAEGNAIATLLDKQRLVLTAADKVLATFGPDDGRVCQPEIGLIIASELVVAHDMISLAWLIETRRMMPLARDAFRDKSRLLTRFGNRVVVGLLSDWKTALTSEAWTKNALDSIGDDRVLNHAYRVLGGRPEVALEVVNDLVPEDLRRRLSEMSTSSGD